MANVGLIKCKFVVSPCTPCLLKVQGIDERFDNAVRLYRIDADVPGFDQGVNDAVSFVQTAVSTVYTFE